MKKILRVLPNPKETSNAYEIDKYGAICGIGGFEKIEIYYTQEEFDNPYLLKKLEDILTRLSPTNGEIIWKK